MEDDFADRLCSMTDDQIMAKLPKQASSFFAEHPALLHAWRLSFTDPAKASAMTSDYFMTLHPDSQYGIVFQISEVHRQAGSLKAYFELENELKQSSVWEDADRFQRYGVNVHIPFDRYHLLVRVISGKIRQHNELLKETKDPQVIISVAKEVVELKKLFDGLNDQLAKIYPELLKTIRGA